MFIDIHAHLGLTGRLPDQRPRLGVEQLIDRMNREGIDQAVLLPLESPENNTTYFLTEQAIEATQRYPERLIAFAHIDPRMRRCTRMIEYFAKTYEVKGYGEMLDGLAFDDPLHLDIYAKCSDLGLPVLFDMGIEQRYCWDEVSLPRVERCLREFTDLVFIGHGPGWWAAISADDDRTVAYPEGPVIRTGAVERLLGEYDNMYADLSATSGYNALTRDPDFTVGFVERHWRKLLFGTDYLYAGQGLPQLEWIRQAPLTSEQREAIASDTARRILRLAH